MKYRVLQGDTAKGEGVMYMVLQGDIALGEGVMYRVLQVDTALLRDRVPLVGLHHPYSKKTVSTVERCRTCCQGVTTAVPVSTGEYLMKHTHTHIYIYIYINL